MGQLDLAAVDVAYAGAVRKIQPLLQIQKKLPAAEALPEIKQLPYHYVETAQGCSVAGWKMPKRSGQCCKGTPIFFSAKAAWANPPSPMPF